MAVTIGEIISLIKDGVLAASAAYILFFIHQADDNALKVQDLTQVAKQLQTNATDTARWAQEARDAANQQHADMQTVASTVAAQQRPVYVMRSPPSGCSVSPSAPAAAGTASRAGSAISGPGVNTGALDVRSAINDFEIRYEGYLAACRELRDSWPK